MYCFEAVTKGRFSVGCDGGQSILRHSKEIKTVIKNLLLCIPPKLHHLVLLKILSKKTLWFKRNEGKTKLKICRL